MTIPSLGILVPFYYSQSGEGELKYLSFSIINVYGRGAWVPTLFCWLISMTTFYVIFVFYRNFATLRQIYLTNPSSLMSFAHLRRITDDFGSLQDARSYFDVSARSVLLTSISSSYGPVELKALLEGSGIGLVESVQPINSPQQVEGLIAKRASHLTDLERELVKFYETLKAATLRPDTPEWRAVQSTQNTSGDLGRSEILDSISRLDRLRVDERSHLLERLLTDPKFMAQYRNENALTEKYQAIRDCEAELNEALREFLRFRSEDLIRLEHHVDDLLPGPVEGYVEKTSLVTLKKAMQLQSNLADLRTTVWGSSWGAVVVFQNRAGASACQQLLLSSRPFSLQVQALPIPDDLIWSNAAMPKADRAQRALLGTVLYITFNMFFIFISSGLSFLADLQNLQDNIAFLKPILTDLGPRVRSIIQGILTPLAFNIAILIAPYILLGILKGTGKTSRSDIQGSLMSNYAWFLFFQTSIIGAVFSSFFEIILIWQQDNLAGILERIRNSMPNASHFFANVILQRASIGLMLVLIQPGVLAKKFAFSALLPASYKTPRMRQAFRNPSDIIPGIIFPEYIVFPFQITMTFLTVTPLSVLPGLLFYGIAAFVFKHQFVYSYAVPNESGGLYWRKLAVHLIAGILMNQIFTIVQFRNHRETILPSMCMLLLIGLTAAYIPFLERTFARICDNIPITPEDSNRKLNITSDLIHKQTHLLQVLQPIETAPLVFARLDAEGDRNLDSDQESIREIELEGGKAKVSEKKSKKHLDKQTINDNAIISLSSFNEKSKSSLNTPNTPSTLNTSTLNTPNTLNKSPLNKSPLNKSDSNVISVPPVIHHSSINERRSYEVVPLALSGPDAASYDPYDVDFLTDRKAVNTPYTHPCMLDHSQVIILPSKLPALMKAILEYPSAADFKQRSNNSQTDMQESPIIMGESALSEPGI